MNEFYLITYAEIWPSMGLLEQHLPVTTSIPRHPADWLVDQRRAIAKDVSAVKCQGIHLLFAMEISEEQYDAIQAVGP